MILQECSLPCCKLLFFKNKGIQLHRIPTDRVRRLQWSKVTGMDLHNTHLVCSRHFRPHDYKDRADKKFLRNHAIPSRCFGSPAVKHRTSRLLPARIKRGDSVRSNIHCDTDLSDSLQDDVIMSSDIVSKENVQEKLDCGDDSLPTSREELIKLWNVIRAQIRKNTRCIATLELISKQQDIKLDTIQNELRILKSGVS